MIKCPECGKKTISSTMIDVGADSYGIYCICNECHEFNRIYGTYDRKKGTLKQKRKYAKYLKEIINPILDRGLWDLKKQYKCKRCGKKLSRFEVANMGHDDYGQVCYPCYPSYKEED